MEAETVEKLATAFEGAATKVGGGADLSSSVSEVIRFLEWLLDILRRFQSQEQIRADLEELDEPSPAMVSLIEGTLLHLPRLIKRWLSLKTNETLTSLGKDGQGRPTAIAVEQWGIVCDEVASQERKGYSFWRAKKFVAKKYGVSARTIHRIWADRSKHPSGESTSLAEAGSFASSLFEDQ